MNDRTLTGAGLIGTLVVVGLVAFGAYGFVTGYLLESPGDLFGPSVGVLAVAVVVVGALTVLGSRSKRWLRSTYW
ncbi:hypothetical protein [Halopiger djelfimassiliensis]|uniref:hypothetical protein n=1 Tax=Halopiger djelfimassiliensis TaxID=1293047 RepID=UPI0006778D04|nr:hypothetical protein [Halopiger djelfimassiliensis]